MESAIFSARIRLAFEDRQAHDGALHVLDRVGLVGLGNETLDDAALRPGHPVHGLVIQSGADRQIGAGDEHVDGRLLLDHRLDLGDDGAAAGKAHRKHTGKAGRYDSHSKYQKAGGSHRSFPGDLEIFDPENGLAIGVIIVNENLPS